jgi:quercetin dioxygenase-like cupin family protein
MKPFYMITALAIGVAGAAVAYDLSDVKTKDILGLTGPIKGKKLKPVVIATQPLGAEGIPELAGRNLRTRFWAIGGPDGVVPIHEHSNRPAMFTVASGEIYEYSSLENKPILHKTGGLAKEAGELAHWWHNAGTETVHLIAFDVQPVAKDFAAVVVDPMPAHVKFDLPVAIGAQHDLLGVVDLGAHFAGAYGAGWALTTYRTTIAPGGIFPDFTGPGEPLQAFVWSGEVQEHRSDIATPITLTEHNGSNLANGATGYWENTGNVDAELYFGVVEPLSEVAGIKPVGVLAHGEH